MTAEATNACSGSTAAHAVFCDLDSDNTYGVKDRPLSGYINFCPSNDGSGLNEAVNKVDALVDTAVHEMIHALFFSPDLFKRYINDQGDRTPCVSTSCSPLRSHPGSEHSKAVNSSTRHAHPV